MQRKKKMKIASGFGQRTAWKLLENCFWIRPKNCLKIASGFDQRTAWKLLLDSTKELLENCFWIRPKNCSKTASGFGTLDMEGNNPKTRPKNCYLTEDSSEKTVIWQKICPKNCYLTEDSSEKLLYDSKK